VVLSDPLDLDLTGRITRERAHRAKARVPAIAGDLRTGGGRRRRSDDPWKTARPPRVSENRGELESVVEDFDCFQAKGEGAARDECCIGEIQETTGSSIGCRTRQEKMSGGCAVSREDVWKKKGCPRSPAAANSAGGACRCRGGRRAIRAAWGRNPGREKGKNGEGDVGVL
jgi:hypothetical protein